MLNIILIIVYTLAIFDFVYHLFAYGKQIAKAQPELRNNNRSLRIKQMLVQVFGQSRLSSQWHGYAHAVVFYAFILFLPINLALLLRRFGISSAWVQYLPAGLLGAMMLIIDIAACLTLCACAIFMVRRLCGFVPSASKRDAYIILGLIAVLMLSHLCLVSVEVRFGRDTSSALAVGLSHLWLPLGVEHAEKLSTYLGFVHLLCVALFMPVIVRGKHLHLLFAPFNLYLWHPDFIAPRLALRAERTPNINQFVDDFDKGVAAGVPETELPCLGVRQIQDFSQKQLLDAFSCAQCSRCTKACPVHTQNPALEPMDLHINLRKLCQNRALGKAMKQEPLSAQLIASQGLWACTSCGACEEACPLGVEHITKFVELKRYDVFSGCVSQELNKLTRNIERSANPWALPQQSRAEVFDGFNSVPGAKILIFAGCMASYEAHEQRTLRAFLSMLQKLGLDFQFLGNTEQCCGDPLRKLGVEPNFQECATHNILAIKRTGCECVVTACPHCAHSLRHSYRDLGFRMPVFHALEWLYREWRQGAIVFESNSAQSLVLHEACYLSNFGDSTPGIAQMLQALPQINLCTVPKKHKHGTCCGAGGGQFWLNHNTEVAQNRIQELCTSGAETLGVSCPFCYAMLNDANLTRGDHLDQPATLTRTINVIEILASAVVVKRSAPDLKNECQVPWVCNRFR